MFTFVDGECQGSKRRRGKVLWIPSDKWRDSKNKTGIAATNLPIVRWSQVIANS